MQKYNFFRTVKILDIFCNFARCYIISFPKIKIEYTCVNMVGNE